MSIADEDLEERSSLMGFFLHFNNEEYTGTFREALETVFVVCRAGRFMHPAELENKACECERRATSILGRDGGMGLNKKEISMLLLYSENFNHDRGSFYSAVNTVLRSKDRDEVRPFRDAIWLLMWALKKCPPYDGMISRGVKLDLSADYTTGKRAYWHQLASCTSDVQVLEYEKFLGTTGNRTLFNIQQEHHRGRSIAAFSVYPEEKEVLLPPNTPFTVLGTLDAGNGLKIINLLEEKSDDPILDFMSQVFPPVEPVPSPVSHPSVSQNIPSVVLNSTETF